MRGAKKYLVGLSSAALVLGSVASLAASASAASPAQTPFSDIAGNSEAAAITFMSSIGAVNGVGNGLFDPTSPVTRAEFAKMIVNLLGLNSVATALANETPSFKDAKSIPTYAWGYVNVAADDGIFVGYPNGDFGPNNNVTDAEAVTALIRAIGDNNQVNQASSSAAWPGNYVSAAYQLDMTQGVNFVANLPATRGDVAQLMYDAAVLSPTYVGSNTTPVVYTKYPPIYLGGINGNPVGGFLAYQGTVSDANATDITLSYGSSTVDSASSFQPACPGTVTQESVSGTITTYDCVATFNWAPSFQLEGASSIASLASGTVTLVYNTNTDQVVYAGLTSGATANTGTLATSSTTVPSGFYDLNNSSATPWLVTNNYACEAQSNGENDAAAPATMYDGQSCSYYLLLGGTTPTTVQLDSVATGSGTTYEVNPASDGSDLGTVANATYLTPGATIQYTLNSNKEATVVQETNVNDQIGLVTSTTCASGCNSTPSAGQPNTITFTVGTSSYTVNVQPYTTLTVNGSTGTLSSSLVNDVAYVATSGGYGTGDVAANPGSGDANASSVALYDNQVSGDVTSISTSTSANNICASAGCNQNDVVSFVLNGTSYTADGNFSGDLGTGQATVALDQSGEARAVISTNVVTTPTVGIVTGTGSTIGVGGATTQSVTINGTAYSVDQSGTWGTVPGETVFNGVYYTGTGAPLLQDISSLGNNGAVLFETSSGAAVGDNGTGLPTALTQLPASGGASCWVIQSTSSSTVTLQGYSACGTSGATAISGDYLTAVLGNGFNNSGSSVGFSGLTTGDVAVVYVSPAVNGETFYAVVDSGNGPTVTGTAQ